MRNANALNCQAPARSVHGEGYAIRRAERAPSSRGVHPPTQRQKQRLRLSLFGGIALRLDTRRVELNNRKAKALMAYLALAPDMRATRDQLVGLLWSETEDTRARASLRQLLHALRDVFNREGIAGLTANRFEVSLDGLALTTDVNDALQSVEGGDPPDHLVNEPIVTDTLLSGYDDLDPSFGTWLHVQRESIRQRLIRGLETQLSHASFLKARTKRIAQALTQVDPTHEIACQTLMSAHVDAGDIAGALAAYKKLWDHLEKDYDMEPSTSTQELVAAIKSGAYQSQTIGFSAADVRMIPNCANSPGAGRLAAGVRGPLASSYSGRGPDNARILERPAVVYLPISYGKRF